MVKLPKKVVNCPLLEAIFEIRYDSEYPSDAVFGMLYTSIKDYFKDIKPQTQPILQLPEAVRQQDPNLRYQAYYKLSKENLSLSIGPRALIFSNIEPYLGLESLSNFFSEILSSIKSTSVLSMIERIGLRYINVFDNKILDHINLGIKIGGNDIVEESTNFRTEINDDGFTKILQIANAINVSIKGKSKIASVIDIDCLYNINEDANSFFNKYSQIIELAHQKEKELFYSLLKVPFLESLNPKYEED